MTPKEPTIYTADEIARTVALFVESGWSPSEAAHEVDIMAQALSPKGGSLYDAAVLVAGLAARNRWRNRS